MRNEPVHLDYQKARAIVQPMSLPTSLAIVGYALCLIFMVLYPFLGLGGWATLGQRLGSWPSALNLGHDLGRLLCALAISVGVAMARARPAVAVRVIVVACVGLIAAATVWHGYTVAATSLARNPEHVLYYLVDRLFIHDVFPALLILLLARSSRFLQPR